MKILNYKERIVCVGIILVSLYLLVFLSLEAKERIKFETKILFEHQRGEFRSTKDTLERMMTKMYQGVRLISLLPGTRNIKGGNLKEGERSAVKIGRFTQEDQNTVQQVYNDLAALVNVSEVYCVLNGFSPEKNETPFFMYDELILKTSSGFVEEQDIKNLDTPLELEDEEYQWYARNIPFIKARYPVFNFQTIDDIPYFLSPLLRTCDNTQYTSKSSGDVKNTFGLIMSVPFYNFENQFRGIISVIFRSNIIEAALLNRPLIPVTSEDFIRAKKEGWSLPEKPGRFLLVKDDLNIQIFDRRAKDLFQIYQTMISDESIKRDEAYYLDHLELPFESEIKLFYVLDEAARNLMIKKVRNDFLLKSIVILLLAVLIILIIWKSASARNSIQQVNLQLEERVEERTKELKEANQRLEESMRELIQIEKLAALGQLSAGVAHEINNPMSFVISNLTTLEKYVSILMKIVSSFEQILDDIELKGTREDLDIIRNNLEEIKKSAQFNHIREDIPDLIAETLEGTQRIKDIVANLTHFIYQGDAEKELVDIQDEIEKAISMAWNELKYKCEIQKDFQEVPKVFSVKGQIGQVFIVILVNAAQAIGEFGKVSIKTYVEDSYCCVKFSDNGAGIPSDIIDKIFDPFFTTKKIGDGTGMGLSIAYGIVKRHGGTINVESEVGKGTSFTIKLPKGSAEYG